MSRRFGVARYVAYVWLVPVVLLALYWAIPHLLFNGMRFTQDVDFWLFKTVLHGAWLWLLVMIMMIVTVVVLAFNCSWTETEMTKGRYGYDEEAKHRRTDKVLQVATAIALVLAFASGYLWWSAQWQNDKDNGRYYANSTAFYVNDPAHVPDSLKNMVDGATPSSDCAMLGKHDVNGCIRQGSLPEEGWDSRVSSFTGAQIAIKRKTEGVQRVSLSDDTVTYLNAFNDAPAQWSGVLDGSGKEQPLYGVAQWVGTGDPTVCRFEEDYAIKRAFAGERGNSLPNLLADTFPSLRYQMIDVWGYCDGDEPVVVIPVTTPIKVSQRTVDTVAGIVTVRGDHGNVKLEHMSDVKAGTYPGPVYPGSMVATQRDQSKWTAGRQNMDRYGFGYDPSSSDEQAGNVSEYLFKDKKSGRLMFVTPLTLRSSDSEVFVAYSVTYADEVSGGKLNELSVYVPDRGDKRLINIDTLAAEANDWMSRNAGMFRANGGRLIEFTPVDGDMWRVFGEMNGQVVYQLDISASRRIAPNLVSLDAYSTMQSDIVVPQPNQPSTSAGTGSGCVAEVSTLTNADLIRCQLSVSNEMAMRMGGN